MQKLFYLGKLLWPVVAALSGVFFFLFLPKKKGREGLFYRIWWGFCLIVVFSFSFQNVFVEWDFIYTFLLFILTALNFHVFFMQLKLKSLKYTLLIWMLVFLVVALILFHIGGILPEILIKRILSLMLILELIFQSVWVYRVSKKSKSTDEFVIMMKGILVWNISAIVAEVLSWNIDLSLLPFLMGFSYIYFLSLIFLEFSSGSVRFIQKKAFYFWSFFVLFVLLFSLTALHYVFLSNWIHSYAVRIVGIVVLFIIFYLIFSKIERKARGLLRIRSEEKVKFLVSELSNISKIMEGNFFENLYSVFEKGLKIDNAHFYSRNRETEQLELSYSHHSPRFLLDNIEQIKKHSFLYDLLNDPKLPEVFVLQEVFSQSFLTDDEREALLMLFKILNCHVMIRLTLRQNFLGFLFLEKDTLIGIEQNPDYWHELYSILPIMGQVLAIGEEKRLLEQKSKTLKLVESEMAVMHRLQHHLYPKEMKQRGLKARGVNFSDFSITCDLYDYFWLDDNKLVFYLIDINDHSVHSALILMLIRAAVKNFFRIKKEAFPAFDAAMNFVLDEYESLHISICIGMVDLRYQRLDLITSGFFYILYGQKGAWKTLQKDNMAIKKSFLFEKGKTLFVISDGMSKQMAWPLEELLDTIIKPAHDGKYSYDELTLYFPKHLKDDISLLGISRE